MIWDFDCFFLKSKHVLLQNHVVLIFKKLAMYSFVSIQPFLVFLPSHSSKHNPAPKPKTASSQTPALGPPAQPEVRPLPEVQRTLSLPKGGSDRLCRPVNTKKAPHQTMRGFLNSNYSVNCSKQPTYQSKSGIANTGSDSRSKPRSKPPSAARARPACHR